MAFGEEGNIIKYRCIVSAMNNNATLVGSVDHVLLNSCSFYTLKHVGVNRVPALNTLLTKLLKLFCKMNERDDETVM